MNHDRNSKLEELFHAAAEQPLASRGTFLARACDGDSDLQQEIEALLNADETSGSFLDTPACEVALASKTYRTVLSGGRIGRYEIVRLIGSGGMGHVYEAVQDRPRRTVALKLLRASLASAAELRRFEYESELLGHLRHPNIAQVFEAGVHHDGPIRVPYFAMEYVADASYLVDHAKATRLGLEERLELFITVCDAVQHGHVKGIVHRDLKPGNVLVDTAGTPKVIDYGVARVVDAEVPMTTMRSSMDALIGTLQYMSPEQLASDSAEVDTRSDVYALGLILFELLAESRPYELNGRTLSKAIRAVEALVPPTVGSIRRELRGDLSTIVARAMEKERDRRYQSAGALAADLRRFLNNEPIEARPASILYRFQKFAARNRSLVAGLAVAVVAVVSGVIVAGWQFRNATIERDRARMEARKAERINAFLGNILAAADPRESTADLSIREALDRAAQLIDAELGAEPEVYADVHATIGSIYERLKHYEQAEHHLRAALKARREVFGEQSCEVASTLSDLAWAVGCRNPEEHERLFREAYSIYRHLYGNEHPLTAAHKSYVASCLVARDAFAEAEDLAREALASLRRGGQADNDKTAFATKILAESLYGQQRLGEAEEAFRTALAVHRNVYDTRHYELGLMLSTMSKFLREVNKTEEAAQLEAEATQIIKARLGNSGA